MSAIFINSPPINILYDLLNKYCVIHNNQYIFDNIVYKKLVFHDNITSFYNNLKEFYNKNKQFYLERIITFNSLLTIIRHILKYHNINYSKTIKYNNNNYNIIYYIDLCSNSF